MKSQLLCVLALCIWFGQICAGSDESIDIDELKRSIRGNITAVGEQFVDDFMTISKENQHNYLIREIFEDMLHMLGHRIPKEKNSKIDVNQVKDNFSRINFSGIEEKTGLDYLKIMQSILSKQFPPERYNGIINLLFACVFNYATTEEIQSALNYLYGIDTEATKISFMDSYNLPKLSSEDECSDYLRLTWIDDAFDRFDDINPKVKQDFLAIREQFPCQSFAVAPLGYFISVLQILRADKWKINACMIRENLANLQFTQDRMERKIGASESVLSTRLPDETIRGIMNFHQATLPGTPIDEIEKALEYLYEDVPKIECPAI